MRKVLVLVFALISTPAWACPVLNSGFTCTSPQDEEAHLVLVRTFEGIDDTAIYLYRVDANANAVVILDDQLRSRPNYLSFTDVTYVGKCVSPNVAILVEQGLKDSVPYTWSQTLVSGGTDQTFRVVLRFELEGFTQETRVYTCE